LGSKPFAAGEYAATVSALDVDAALQKALMECDQEALNGMLGGRKTMCCLVVAAETVQ
jgi:hypothetical protein